MKIIGLTGPSGTGKSSLADLAKELGYYVIDCDKTAALVANDREVLSRLEAAFGGVVQNGRLNRKALAARAFQNEEQTKRLNAIMLPPVRVEIIKEIEREKARGRELFLLDAPTLYESGLDEICDAVVAVLADFALRAKRIRERDGLTEAELQTRLQAAKTDSFYSGRTGHIIYNNGDWKTYQTAAKSLLERLAQ